MFAKYPSSMAAREYHLEIDAVDATLVSIEKVLDLPKLRKQADELEVEAGVPNLWDDPEAAQKITSRLSRVQSVIAKLSGLRQRVEDLSILFELAAGEPGGFQDAESELDAVKKSVGELEVQTLLNGEYDDRDALITIRSEAGGVEAADWAEMIMRMYLRYCERHNFTVNVLETSYAEEAGIKSTTFKVSAPYAYGTLSVEQGTHRLVRISPFDSQSRRHTSFAGVEVVPSAAVPPQNTASQVAAVAPEPIVPASGSQTGEDFLLVRAKGTTWVQVVDANGAVLLRRTLQGGTTTAVNGAPPLAVVVGKADLAEVEVRGKPFVMTDVSKDNVARFEVK